MFHPSNSFESLQHTTHLLLLRLVSQLSFYHLTDLTESRTFRRLQIPAHLHDRVAGKKKVIHAWMKLITTRFVIVEFQTFTLEASTEYLLETVLKSSQIRQIMRGLCRWWRSFIRDLFIRTPAPPSLILLPWNSSYMASQLCDHVANRQNCGLTHTRTTDDWALTPIHSPPMHSYRQWCDSHVKRVYTEVVEETSSLCSHSVTLKDFGDWEMTQRRVNQNP